MFTAGYEIDVQRVKGRPIELALSGWGISLMLGPALGYLLQLRAGCSTAWWLGSPSRPPRSAPCRRGTTGAWSRALQGVRHGGRHGRRVRTDHRSRAAARDRADRRGHARAHRLRAPGPWRRPSRLASARGADSQPAPPAPRHDQPVPAPRRRADRDPPLVGGQEPRSRRAPRIPHRWDRRPTGQHGRRPSTGCAPSSRRSGSASSSRSSSSSGSCRSSSARSSEIASSCSMCRCSSRSSPSCGTRLCSSADRASPPANASGWRCFRLLRCRLSSSSPTSGSRATSCGPRSGRTRVGRDPLGDDLSDSGALALAAPWGGSRRAGAGPSGRGIGPVGPGGRRAGAAAPGGELTGTRASHRVGPARG